MADIYKLLLDKLDAQSILSPEEASKRPASLWLSKENLECKAFARPKTTEELSIILKTCNEHSQTLCPTVDSQAWQEVRKPQPMT